MALSNLQRMIQLAEKVFDTKSDPGQLDINEDVLKRLRLIHPATISEYDDGNGPVAWVLLLPTTQELMHRFLDKKISEKQLFELTKPGISYDAIYLCSALVLEEYRRKGITKQLTLDAIKKIEKDHDIKALFVWPFTQEGGLAATALENSTSLPIYKRLDE